jgi:hypothetical protein
MRKQESTAVKPAVTLPGIMTEQDRAIVARREAGETRKAISDSIGITLSVIQRAEWRCEREQKARKMLAECADSIKGLWWLRELSSDAYEALANHEYHYDGGELQRMSDVAALGRRYVSCLKGIGPKSLASIDRALDLLGIAWSPVDRTPTPKPRETERQVSSGNSAWFDIVRRVGEIEQIMRTGVFEGDPHRDSIECVAMRLAFLTGYLEGYVEKRRPHKPMRDITPEANSGEDMETAGNLVCLPGVKLSDVLQNDGGQP